MSTGGTAGSVGGGGGAGVTSTGDAAGSVGGVAGAGGDPLVIGAGGTAGRCEVDRLTAAEATSLYRSYAFQVQPDLNPTVIFEASELDVAGLWEDLHAQLFYVAGKSQEGSPFRDCTVLTHACQVFVPAGECSQVTSTLSSGLVVNGAFYFSWGTGSGAFRSRLGKLAPNAAKFNRSVSPEYFNPGYRPPPLVLEVSGADIFVHRAVNALEFNGPASAEKIGKLKDLGDTLTIVDDSGNAIATALP